MFDVVDEVDCSVLLAERPAARGFRERLFGTSAEKRSAVEGKEPETAPEVDASSTSES